MTVLATTHPTLIDIARASDPDGKIAKVVEILGQTNEILEDAVWVEGNLPTGHVTTVRTGLPAPTWRKLNYGVLPTKGTTAQVTATAGNLEAYAEVDVKLAELNGNTEAFRLSEDKSHIEGMNIEMAQTMFYGNDLLDDAEFTGFAAHYNSLSANNGDNIVQPAAGVDGSDNASMWLMVWSPETVHMFYPKGWESGLQVDDLGEVTLETAPGGPNGGRMQAYRSHYQWAAGLAVRDWRYVVRIQYNQEDLVKDAATGPDLIDLMTDAVERIPSLGMGRAVFYANRRTRAFLRKQVRHAVGNTLTLDNFEGRRVLTFDGIPIRSTDALLNTEAAVA